MVHLTTENTSVLVVPLDNPRRVTYTRIKTNGPVKVEGLLVKLIGYRHRNGDHNFFGVMADGEYVDRLDIEDDATYTTAFARIRQCLDRYFTFYGGGL